MWIALTKCTGERLHLGEKTFYLIYDVMDRVSCLALVGGVSFMRGKKRKEVNVQGKFECRCGGRNKFIKGGHTYGRARVLKTILTKFLLFEKREMPLRQGTRMEHIIS